MGIAFSLQYFPLDLRKLGFFPLHEKASPPNKPMVTNREEKQDQLPFVVPPQSKSHRVSTRPQYLTVAHRQAAAKVRIDQQKVSPAPLTPDDREAAVKNPKRSINSQGDRAQRFVSSINQAVSVSQEARTSRQAVKPLKVFGSRRSNKIRRLDRKIVGAIQAEDMTSLRELLDAHPHVRRDPADKFVGTFILNCFREIASWFNSAAFAWQGNQAVALLNEAARVGNTEVIQILLDRGMDLGKDKPMVEPALKISVASGNAAATGLLLGEVLRDNPDYVKNSDLAGIAAGNRHASVLEVLVEQGMDLPLKNTWPRYGQAIEDFLLWKESCRLPGKGHETLSCMLQMDIKERLAGLRPQFGWQLNGMRSSLNSVQKGWLRAAICACSESFRVEEKIYTAADLTVQTAKKLTEKLNSNAVLYISQRAETASATLAHVIAFEFKNITSTGQIRPDLLKHLMDQGMYGLVADVVVDAAKSAVASPSWKEPGANRKILFANALDRSARDREEFVDQARDASGDPDLFDQLLTLQLNLLIAYQQSCHASDPVHSGRKRRASI